MIVKKDVNMIGEMCDSCSLSYILKEGAIVMLDRKSPCQQRGKKKDVECLRKQFVFLLINFL